jgi:hypothetical protein
MSSLDLELDGDVNDLETEWRRAYEVFVAARTDYERLQDCCKANGGLLDVARMRMERAEAIKMRLMARVERAEDRLIGGSTA